MKIPLAACAAIFCLLADSAQAVSITLFASKDAAIYEDSTSSPRGRSNGAGDYLFAGRNGNGGGNLAMRSLIAFDIASSIPAGATIDSASLSLFNTSPITFGNTLVSIHRVLGDWGEGPSVPPFAGQGGEANGATPVAGDVSWLDRFTGTPGAVWTNPGGDFVPSASATTLVLDEGFDYAWSSAQAAADVQSWLDNPSQNFGWILIGNESAIAKRFSSRTGPEVPFLDIEFTPIPEPSLPLLTGVSLMAFLSRRRR